MADQVKPEVKDEVQTKPEVQAKEVIAKGELVEFTQDVAPYCKGDVVRLDEDVFAYVRKRCATVGIKGKPYKTVKG